MDFYEVLSDIMREKHMSIPDVAVACGLTDSEGRGFESLRAGHKKPHEIAVFRLFRRFFLLLLFIDFYRILSLFILFYGSMYGSNPSQN